MSRVALWERLTGGWQVLLAPGAGEEFALHVGPFDVVIAMSNAVVHWVRVMDPVTPMAWRRDEMEPACAVAPGMIEARLRTVDTDMHSVLIDLGPHGGVYVVYEPAPQAARLSAVLLSGPCADATMDRLQDM